MQLRIHLAGNFRVNRSYKRLRCGPTLLTRLAFAFDLAGTLAFFGTVKLAFESAATIQFLDAALTAGDDFTLLRAGFAAASGAHLGELVPAGNTGDGELDMEVPGLQETVRRRQSFRNLLPFFLQMFEEAVGKRHAQGQHFRAVGGCPDRS